MKKKIIIISLIIVILLLIVGSIVFINYNKKQQELKEEQRINTLVKDIKSHYSEYVVTTKETKLYKKEQDKYIEFGKINENVKISLNEIKIDKDTKYFHIKDFDLYIEYNSVEPTEEYLKDDRYSNYIPFNKNITTNNPNINKKIIPKIFA